MRLDKFQMAVRDWSVTCFGQEIADDKDERNHRFLEESLELVQSLGCTEEEVHLLVKYVFGRPIGEPLQELGGVMVTLCALANANKFDLSDAATGELARIWEKVEKIREKQKNKPKFSPLPQ